MQNQKEPTDKNIEEAVVQPGTHLFYVEPTNLAKVRSRIYYWNANTVFGLSTTYDRTKRVLKVFISNG